MLEIYYKPLVFITKLSILIQYMKIFVPNHKGKTYWWIHILIWTNLLFYTAVMLVQIMACLPREKLWNPKVPGRCINIPHLLVTVAAVNIVSDVSILVLPLGKVWQLRISARRKIGVSAVFAAGVL